MILCIVQVTIHKLGFLFTLVLQKINFRKRSQTDMCKICHYVLRFVRQVSFLFVLSTHNLIFSSINYIQRQE